MKKGEIIYIIYNARSDIRAAVCVRLNFMALLYLSIVKEKSRKLLSSYEVV